MSYERFLILETYNRKAMAPFGNTTNEWRLWDLLLFLVSTRVTKMSTLLVMRTTVFLVNTPPVKEEVDISSLFYWQMFDDPVEHMMTVWWWDLTQLKPTSNELQTEQICPSFLSPNRCINPRRRTSDDFHRSVQQFLEFFFPFKHAVYVIHFR